MYRSWVEYYYYLQILGCYSQILSIILLCRDLGSSIISNLGSSIILLFTDLGLLFTDLEYYFIVQRYCTSHSKAKLQYNIHFTYSLKSFTPVDLHSIWQRETWLDNSKLYPISLNNIIILNPRSKIILDPF